MVNNEFPMTISLRVSLSLLTTALALSVGLSGCGDDLLSSRRIGPRLTISQTSFVFGYVPQHSTISHVFWLHSTGDDTLRILKIVPG
jgi:hypothetical protein